MAALLDASVWIDFTRKRSPRKLKELIAPHVHDPGARIAEPVVFEVMRHATDDEIEQLEAQFATMLMIATPPNLWRAAAELGQQCRRRGINAGSLDLLVASIALHHDASVITFDADFERIAAVTDLRVKRLHRPTTF